jgi:hypothetical protein
MAHRELVPVSPLGRRLRKALVAGSLLATAPAASQLVRSPAWDGWCDVFTWPQLFLCAPVLFFFGAAMWQSAFFVAGYFCQQDKRALRTLGSEPSPRSERTLGFWLRDSLRIGLLYVAACVIGDIPLAVKYLAAIRGWPLHWWWSSAVWACLVLTVAVSWTLDQIHDPRP